MDTTYLTLDESLQYLSMDKSDFLLLISHGYFQPCFLSQITLLGYADLGEPYFENIVCGYIPFEGYITPMNISDLAERLDGGVKVISIDEVKVIGRPLNSKKIEIYISWFPPGWEYPENFRQGFNLKSQETYRVCDKELEYSSLHVSNVGCVFIQEELEKFKYPEEYRRKMALRELEKKAEAEKKAEMKAEAEMKESKKRTKKGEFTDTVLSALKELGYDPLALPKKKNGYDGVRSEVKQFLANNSTTAYLLKKETTFNKYWGDLKEANVIVDVEIE